MKKNNFWKRFWTLNVHNHEGFTLVELIIVIAILAILASVAVVGYSAYIEKANKQADLTLANEVANALTLAYYSNMSSGGGYVILTENGAIGDGSQWIDDVMTNAFGGNWDAEGNKAMSLKYNGWSSSATSSNVAAIAGSNFSEKNLSSMLESVSSLTNVLGGFLDGGTITIDDLNAFAQANGIDPATASGQELANLMPMVIAQNLTNKLNETGSINSSGDTAQTKFVELYSDGSFLTQNGGALATKLQNDLNLDMYTAYAVEYAQMEGMLNYFATNGTEEEKEKGQALLAQWKADTADLQNNYAGSGTAMVNTLLTTTKQNILAAGFSQATFTGYFDNAGQDAKALGGYMEGLNETASTLLKDTESIKSDEYYKSQNISDIIVSYLDATQMIIDANVDGSVGIVLIDSNGNVKILLSE